VAALPAVKLEINRSIQIFTLPPNSPSPQIHPRCRKCSMYSFSGRGMNLGALPSGWTLNLHWMSIWEILNSGVVLNLHALVIWREIKSEAR